MVTTDIKDTILHPSFKNNFWNAEIGNFSGFEVLVKRSKESRTLCKDFTDFIKQRAQIEEQYGKSLLKLAKLQIGGEEFGPLRKIWETLKDHTEAVGVSHSQAAQQLDNEIGCVHEFLESSKDRRRWAEENSRTLQTQIKTAHKRMLDLRKLYECRCREEVQASHSYHQEVARGGEESGGADKAAARHSKARSSMESAETAYRGSVDYLQEVKELWEKETESTAEIFQIKMDDFFCEDSLYERASSMTDLELETTRLTLLRDSIWKLSNILSSVCVTDDEAYEDTRKVLETSDIEEGVQLFIAQHQTGTKRPGAIKPESIPNSSTIGMGHARQYESGSLSRAKHFSSLGHLVDAGRSRSDLGFLHQDPPARPKKPPRLHTYEPPRDTTIIGTPRINNNREDNSGENEEPGLVSGRLLEPAAKPAMKHHLPATRPNNGASNHIMTSQVHQSAVMTSQHQQSAVMTQQNSPSAVMGPQQQPSNGMTSQNKAGMTSQQPRKGSAVMGPRGLAGGSQQMIDSGPRTPSTPSAVHTGARSGQRPIAMVPAGSRSRRSQSRDRLERHTIPICIENSEYYGIQSKQASQTLPNNAPSPVKDYRPSTGTLSSSNSSTPLNGTINKKSSYSKTTVKETGHPQVVGGEKSGHSSQSQPQAQQSSSSQPQQHLHQPQQQHHQGKQELRTAIPPGKISCGSESSDSSSQDSGKYSAESSPSGISNRYYPPASPSPESRYYSPTSPTSTPRHRRASVSPTRSPPFTSPPYRNGGGHHLARPSPSSSPYRAGPGGGATAMTASPATHYRSPSQPPTPSQYRHHGGGNGPHEGAYRSASVARVPMSSAPQSSYHQQNQQHGMLSRQHSLHNMATMRRARVLCEYKQKNNTEVSLPRNELVWVVEGEEGEEWWWVRSDQGRGGYFPANFLRVIDSPT